MCVCCVLSIHVCTGVLAGASETQEVVKEGVRNHVAQVVRPRLPPRLLGVTGSDDDAPNSDRGRRSGTAPVAANKTGGVILPDNVDEVLSEFLADKLTKKKGHNDTVRHFGLWKTFHNAKLGGSDDYLLERCVDDTMRAKTWSLFIRELHALNIKEGQIHKILSGVRHQFQINTKSITFIDESTLITSMRKAIKPTTSQIREDAITNSQHVKLPMPTEVTDRAHDEGWMKSDWEWDGTLSRGISLATDLILRKGFRASNVTAPGPNEEDHAVRYSDVVFMVREGGMDRRVIASPGLTSIDEAAVVCFQAHVYSTKTGAVKGSKIPYTVTRDSDLGDRLVTKAFLWVKNMVQSTIFNIEDPLCTVYREDKKGKWHRRLTRRSDISGIVKNSAVAFGIPKHHAASSSLRKTRATNTRLQGGDDQAVAAAGGWAKDKNGQSAVAGRHYDLSSVTGREGATGTTGLTVNEVLNMVPLRSEKSTRVSAVASAGSSVIKPKVACKATKKKGTKVAMAVSPKDYKKKK